MNRAPGSPDLEDVEVEFGVLDTQKKGLITHDSMRHRRRCNPLGLRMSTVVSYGFPVMPHVLAHDSTKSTKALECDEPVAHCLSAR